MHRSNKEASALSQNTFLYYIGLLLDIDENLNTIEEVQHLRKDIWMSVHGTEGQF
jgi:hypothetical protein